MTTHCPIVFDYIVPVSKPRARKTDPQTSHDAAARLSDSRCEALRLEIYGILKRYGGHTVKEISGLIYTHSELTAGHVEVGKRINEVRGIAPTGEQRNGERVWGLI